MTHRVSYRLTVASTFPSIVSHVVFSLFISCWSFLLSSSDNVRSCCISSWSWTIEFKRFLFASISLKRTWGKRDNFGRWTQVQWVIHRLTKMSFQLAITLDIRTSFSCRFLLTTSKLAPAGSACASNLLFSSTSQASIGFVSCFHSSIFVFWSPSSSFFLWFSLQVRFWIKRNSQNNLKSIDRLN